jgi:hypothetical protein
MTLSFIELAKHLTALHQVSDEFDASSEEVMLVKEYFRRVSVLAQELGRWHGGPFFDPVKLLGEPLLGDAERIIADFSTASNQPNAYVRRVCIDALRWTALAEQGEPLPQRHSDLFEPLIVLFERGCGFGLHHGELLIGGFAIPLQNWQGGV